MNEKTFRTKESAAEFIMYEYSLKQEEAYLAVFEEAYETTEGEVVMPLSRFVKRA